jgi:hypothetical protein
MPACVARRDRLGDDWITRVDGAVRSQRQGDSREKPYVLATSTTRNLSDQISRKLKIGASMHRPTTISRCWR